MDKFINVMGFLATAVILFLVVVAIFEWLKSITKDWRDYRKGAKLQRSIKSLDKRNEMLNIRYKDLWELIEKEQEDLHNLKVTKADLISNIRELETTKAAMEFNNGN